jgi:hypothetical protein
MLAPTPGTGARHLDEREILKAAPSIYRAKAACYRPAR